MYYLYSAGDYVNTFSTFINKLILILNLTLAIGNI